MTSNTKLSLPSSRSSKGSMQNNRINRQLTFLLIFLLHVVLIFIWLSASTSRREITPNKQAFFLIAVPQQKSATKVPQQQKLIKPNVIPKTTLASRKSVQTSVALTTTIQASPQPQPQLPEAKTSATPVPLQKDIRTLSQSLKEDFLKQEKNFRPDSKSQSETMKKFSNAIVDAAQIQREGVIIEKKFAYDGRPVSKIKTPYGTYCVRHPKAGEKLELSPPPLPVTCGQL